MTPGTSLPQVARLPAGPRFVDYAARVIAEQLSACAQMQGACRLALAGGQTPRVIYLRLAAPDLASSVAWERVQVFFGDERAVPPDHPASNFRMAREALLDRVPLTADQIHRMRGELAPETAASAYGAALGDAPLDLVLLGLGTDGHTASLFPGDPASLVTDRPVVATRSPVAPFDRISLSLATLCRARCVTFLVSGEAKADALQRILTEPQALTHPLPAARVTASTLLFVVDAAALPSPDSSGRLYRLADAAGDL